MIYAIGAIFLVIFLLCVGYVALMKNGWENDRGEQP